MFRATHNPVLIALACLFMLSAACAQAEDPAQSFEADAPTFTVYGTRDGLSDEIWSAIGFDRDGFVWAGSASALARFDGYRWMPVVVPGARSLVRDLEQDEDGTLWAVFEREGLARLDGQAWHLDDSIQGYLQRFSVEANAPKGNRLWVGTEDRLWSRQGSQWVLDGGAPAPGGSRYLGVVETDALFGQHRQWLATFFGGLWYRELTQGHAPGAWQRFEDTRFQDAWQSNGLLRVVRDGVEELWVLSYGDGVARIRSDGTRVWRMADGELPTEAIYEAVATYDSQSRPTVWIASRAGLLRFSGDNMSVFDRRHGLPADAVRGLAVQRSPDGVELLWVATERGIARAALTASQWRTVSLIGARENGVFTVLPEPDGHGGQRVWVGSAREGLALLEDGHWTRFTQANGRLPSEGVRQIWNLMGPEGRSWRVLSLGDGRLMRIDDQLRMHEIEVPWRGQVGELVAHALSRKTDAGQELWFATLHSGIYRLLNGQWTQFLANDGRADWTVIHLAEQIDGQGRSWLWAGSESGLARFDGTHWQLLRDVPGLPDDSFPGLSLIPDAGRAVLWAASSHNGVVRVDVSDPLHPRHIDDDRVPPAPDPAVYTALPEHAGRIYVCTNNGVQMLTQGRDGRYAETVFRRRDGLVHDECNTNAQAIDSDNRYWVGMLGGLSVFDPSIDANVQTVPKPLHFTGISVDGHRQAIEAGKPVRIPAGSHEVQIDFTLLSGMRELGSLYRSELVGAETEMTEWRHEHQRQFSGLAPGEYRLRVEARDFAGTPATPRELAFTVEAFWWQRPIVQWLALATLLMLAVAGVLLYNRGLRQRQRELKSEVERSTRELRKANERLTELSYVDPLTGIANRRRLIEVAEEAIQRGVQRGLPVGLIVIDVDHFKPYNDRYGHVAGDAALRAVAQAIESATRKQDLVARFGGEEFACLMIDADIDTVALCAERMRPLVAALPPRVLGNSTESITISAGILSRIPHPGDHAADLLREADAALYRAKNEGRNRVARTSAQ